MTFVRLSLTALLAAATLQHGLPALAQTRSVDPREFDVAGVKTGMDMQQAIAAAAAHFGVPKSQVKVDPYPGVDVVTKTRLQRYFTIEKGSARLSVHFDPRVPLDKAHPSAVSFITYELPWTGENKSAMAKAAAEKYGAPTAEALTYGMHWCERPRANIGCDDMDEPRLALSGVKMTLSDPAWGKAARKFSDEAKTVKPSF
jgi:hypothetical protein